MNYKNYFKLNLIEAVERYSTELSTQDEPQDETLPQIFPGSRHPTPGDMQIYGNYGGELRLTPRLPWQGWPYNLPSPEDYKNLDRDALWKYIPSWHPMWLRPYKDGSGNTIFPNGKPSSPDQIPVRWRWNPNRFGGRGGWTAEDPNGPYWN